jgi:hypothetical protein
MILNKPNKATGMGIFFDQIFVGISLILTEKRRASFFLSSFLQMPCRIEQKANVKQIFPGIIAMAEE